MIVNRYTKMTLNISVTKNINAMKFIEIINKKKSICSLTIRKKLFQIENSFLLIRIEQKYAFIWKRNVTQHTSRYLAGGTFHPPLSLYPLTEGTFHLACLLHTS